MINAVYAPLDSAPKGFAGVDVSNTRNVLLGGVLDDFVSIAESETV